MNKKSRKRAGVSFSEYKVNRELQSSYGNVPVIVRPWKSKSKYNPTNPQSKKDDTNWGKV